MSSDAVRAWSLAVRAIHNTLAILPGGNAGKLVDLIVACVVESDALRAKIQEVTKQERDTLP